MYQSSRLGVSWEEDGPRDVCKVQLAHPEMHSLVQGVAQKAAKICLPPLCFSSSGYMIPSPSAMPRQLVCLGITCLLPLEEPIHPSILRERRQPNSASGSPAGERAGVGGRTTHCERKSLRGHGISHKQDINWSGTEENSTCGHRDEKSR